MRVAGALFLRGRLPLRPRWIRRRRALREMLRHIIPVEGPA